MSAAGTPLVGHADGKELRAFVRVFGLGGARELALRTERPMREALAGLWGVLAPNLALLARLHALLQARQPIGTIFHVHASLRRFQSLGTQLF